MGPVEDLQEHLSSPSLFLFIKSSGLATDETAKKVDGWGALIV